ncbi:HU family DNA-binding protein [Vibrio parahaemolyticus]|uniref:HU family DNA-binding protein n=1 Tax=Vibrio parahaemolyticus TaxID=670 RepID=UPI0023ED37B9|nr:HU family DNA-binding protein [Vibrio parahaemolyticus]
MKLTKRALGELICDELPLVPREAEKLIADMFEEISGELANGKEVSLHGFGQFRLLDKPPRPGRNPKTGEECTISARTVCVLKPGVWLQNASQAYAQTHAVTLQD